MEWVSHPSLDLLRWARPPILVPSITEVLEARNSQTTLKELFQPTTRPAAIELLACRLNDPMVAERCRKRLKRLLTDIPFEQSVFALLDNPVNKASIRKNTGKGHPAESKAEGTPHEYKEKERLIQKRHLEEGLEETVECRYDGVTSKRVKASGNCRAEESDHYTADWDKLRAELVDAKNRDNESLINVRIFLPGSKLNDEDVDNILQTFGWDPRFQVLKSSYFEEGWTPDANALFKDPRTEMLILPICRKKHWTLLVVQLGDRVIYHFDSLQCPSFGHESCTICQSMATTVDRALISRKSKLAISKSWDFRIWNEESSRLISPQQRNDVDCGIYLLHNAHCVSRDLNPWDASFVADELRAKFTAKLLREDARSGIIPEHMMHFLVSTGPVTTETVNAETKDIMPADKHQAYVEREDSTQSPAIDENVQNRDGIEASCNELCLGDASRSSRSEFESPATFDAGSSFLPMTEFNGVEAAIQSPTIDSAEDFPLSKFINEDEGLSELNFIEQSDWIS